MGDCAQGTHLREIAFEALTQIEERAAYANLVLRASLERASLSGRDASFVTELVAGTCRMRGKYDRIIELATVRSLSRIHAVPLRILRLGIHQIETMRLQDFAAVDTSVKLQEKYGKNAHKGFVNAVLRKVCRGTEGKAQNTAKIQLYDHEYVLTAWEQEILAHAPDRDTALAQIFSHPLWMVRAFRKSLKQEWAKDERAGEKERREQNARIERDLERMLRADNCPPKVHLACFEPAQKREGSAHMQMSELGEKSEFAPRGYVLQKGSVSQVQRAGAGADLLVRAQDVGSQLAAEVFLSLAPIEQGERWLDLCAAPGGKAAYIAHTAYQNGVPFRANEKSAARAQLVERSLRQMCAHSAQHIGGDAFRNCADPVDITCADGRSNTPYMIAPYASAPAPFTRILIDAPCSGIGSLRRKAESRWVKHPEDIVQLAELQMQLLTKAFTHLRCGGHIVYVTCSPHPSETYKLIHRFLAQTNAKESKCTLVNVPDILDRILPNSHPHFSQTAKAPFVQLWPHKHGTDAMFIAVLRKNPET